MINIKIGLRHALWKKEGAVAVASLDDAETNAPRSTFLVLLLLLVFNEFNYCCCIYQRRHMRH